MTNIRDIEREREREGRGRGMPTGKDGERELIRS